MPIESNYIKINGRETFYRSSGEDKRKPLILIHGLAGDSRLFHNQLKHFALHCRVIAPDLPGHGKSETSEINSLSAYSSILDSIISNEDFENIILLGHSMGGSVALQYYLSHRDKVKALILVSTAQRFIINHEAVEMAENDFENFYKSLIIGSFSKKAALFLMAIQNGIPEDLKKTVLNDLQICSVINFEDKLEKIDVPVLILANKDDPVVDSELTAHLNQKIPGSILKLFDNRGHVPFFEESRSFNLEVEQFMDKI